LPASAGSTTSAQLADGTWYFNLRTKDNAGNWAEPVHSGPYHIGYAAQSLGGWFAAGTGDNCVMQAAVGDGIAAVVEVWDQSPGLTWYDIAIGQRHDTTIAASNPAVSQGKIAFYGPLGTLSVLDTTTGEVALTGIDGAEARPGRQAVNRYFFGDNIVYLDAFDSHIKIYNLSTLETVDTGIATLYNNPQISGDIVSAVDAGGRVVYYNIADGQTTTVGPGSAPVVAGDIISYISAANTLAYYTIGTGQIADTGIYAATQSTDGERIVYGNGTNFLIYDIAAGQSQTSGMGYVCMCTMPDISGNHALIERWEGDEPVVDLNGDGDTNDCIVSGWDFATETVSTTASLSGALGQAGWFTSDVEVTLSGADSTGSPIALTEYSFDGSSWTEYTEPFTIANEGPSTLWLRSTNEAGKVETPKQRLIRIDKTGPAITLNTPANRTYVLGETATVEYAATDDISGLAALSGTQASGSTLDTTSSEGQHDFVVSAVDKAGNTTQRAAIYYLDKPGWFSMGNGDNCGTQASIDGTVAAVAEALYFGGYLSWYDMAAAARHDTTVSAANPAVSQGKIAFYQPDISGVISLFDTQTGEVASTDITAAADRPPYWAGGPSKYFFGDNIVYRDAIDAQVKVYNISTHETLDTGIVELGAAPQINGDIVTATDAEGRVVFYSISSGQTTVVGPGSAPVVAGDIVSYISAGGTLAYHSISSSGTVDTGIPATRQSTDGERIVYVFESSGPSGRNFAVYDIATGQSQASGTSTTCLCSAPDISGGIVVVERYEGEGTLADLNGNGYTNDCVAVGWDLSTVKAAPTGTAVIDNDALWAKSAAVSIDSTISGAGLMRFSAGGGSWTDWQSYETSRLIELLPGDGTKTVQGQFKADYGAINVLETGDTIILDTEAPVTGIVSPANNNQVDGTVTIDAVADDALAGTDRVEFYANGDLIGEDGEAPYQIDWNSNNEINGPSVLSVVAADNLGNITGSQPVQVEVNNALPFTAAGTIKDWLLVGPFMSQDLSTTLANDYLAGENTIKPSENATASGDTTWTAYTATSDAVDMSAFFPAASSTETTDLIVDSSGSVAYANVYVNSPISHTAQLRLGSDDGVKAWVNGEVVIDNNVIRNFASDEDTPAIRLNQGWNQLLIKVADIATDTAGRTFSAKISDFEGGEIPGLAYQLNNPFTEVLFEDNFNQEATAPASKWVSEGLNQIEYNTLRTEGTMLSAQDMPQENYSISLKLNPVTWNSGQTTTFFLRAQDKDNGYFFRADSGYYQTIIGFFKRSAGTDTQIGSSVVFPLELGREGAIKIEAQENNFKLFADNTLLLNVDDPDSTYPSPGKVGFAQGGEASFFDNFEVGSVVENYMLIAGRVSDSENWSQAGLSVVASEVLATDTAETEVQEYAGITAGDGSYSIAIPESGGPKTFSVAVDSDYYSAKETTVTLSSANNAQVADFILDNPATIYGQVTDSSGSPLADAQIGAFRLDGNSGSGETQSDGFGNFSFPYLDVPGTYQLLLDAFGYSSTITPEISVYSGESTTITTIALTPAGKISGTVVDAYSNPVAGVYVSANIPGDENASRGTTTAADGSYIIEDIDAPNVYEVEVLSEDYELNAKENIQAQPGQTTSDVDFVLGLRPAWGAQCGEEKKHDNWADIIGLNRDSHGQSRDTHQWITRQAVGIIANDSYKIGLETLRRLVQFSDPKARNVPWYWISRGVTRADLKNDQTEGYSQHHIHGETTHMGEWWNLFASAATDANQAFNDALTAWKDGKQERAMYLLGLALHHVQDLRNPQHTIIRFGSHLPGNDYEEWANDYKEKMAVYYGGIYQGDFNGFRTSIGQLHQPNDSAWGWVDRSAHVSARWVGLVQSGHYPTPKEFGPSNWEMSQPLVESAQKFSAGFLKFFFDQAESPETTSSIKVKLTFDHNQFDEMELHLLRPGASYYDYPGDINYWNYWADWGEPGVRIDDPIFYGDDDEEPQEASLLKPSDTGAYKVMVDFDDEDLWRNDGKGGEAFIDVWIDDIHIGQYRSGLQHEDTLWTPVEIDIPSGKVRRVNRFE